MGSRSRMFVHDPNRPTPMPADADPQDEMFYGYLDDLRHVDDIDDMPTENEIQRDLQAFSRSDRHFQFLYDLTVEVKAVTNTLGSRARASQRQLPSSART